MNHHMKQRREERWIYIAQFMNVYNNESKVDNEKTICNSNFHGTETKTNPITPTDNSFLHCENANQGKSLNTYKSIGQKQLLKLNCPILN